MAKAKKAVAAKGKIKKRWFNILATQDFGSRKVGETPSFESQALVGKTVDIDLTTLIGDIKRQHVKITFEITNVEGDNAITILKKYEMIPSFIKRTVRRGRTRIDKTIVVGTKDNRKTVFKVLGVGINKIGGTQQAALRRGIIYIISKIAKENTSEEVIRKLVSGDIQREIREFIRKIYPLRFCDVRYYLMKNENLNAGEVLERVKIEEPKEETEEDLEEEEPKETVQADEVPAETPQYEEVQAQAE